MNIQVLSRKQFEEYAAKEHRLTSIVISITAHNEDEVILPMGIDNKIESILRIRANDVDDVIKGGMSLDQGIAIAKFVRHYSHQPIDKIIVHCGAGQSRSAGVAAAILKYYTGSDEQIFGNKRYTPNMLFYRKTLEALYTV